MKVYVDSKNIELTEELFKRASVYDWYNCNLDDELELVSLANHDKQVRKQVCDEIRKFYTNPVYDRENAHTEVRVLLARLDQIEGE